MSYLIGNPENRFSRGMAQTYFYSVVRETVEPRHDKTNKMACSPSKDSDQPGHLPSLIRVFAVRMKKAWVLNYLLSP